MYIWCCQSESTSKQNLLSDIQANEQEIHVCKTLTSHHENVCVCIVVMPWPWIQTPTGIILNNWTQKLNYPVTIQIHVRCRYIAIGTLQSAISL